MRTLLLLGVLALSGGAQSAPPVLDVSALERLLEAQCAAGEFSGVVVVRVGEKELFHRICGLNAESGAPIERATRFKIFSTSKLLTALAVLRLSELGELPLDAPAGEFVEGLPPEWSEVTLRHLLEHRSGLPDLTERLLAEYRSDHPQALRATLAAAEKEHLVPSSEPGTAWRYNNFGYELLAAAAATAHRAPFEEVLAELVFTPAGMKDALVERALPRAGGVTSVADARLVPGFNGAPGKLEPAHSQSFVQLGAGAVHATVDDLLALDSALRAGRVVSPASWAAMHPREGGGYGLGLMCRTVEGLRLEGHDGGTNGYLSTFQRFPEQDAVLVVLSNLGFAKLAEIEQAVARVLAQVPAAHATK